MAARDDVKSVFKVTRKTFFNPSSWIGWNGLSDQLRTTWAAIKELFTARKPERQETFEQAMQRFGLTDQDVELIRKRYFYYSVLFLVLAGIVLIYAFYLLILRYTFSGWLLGMAVTALLLSNAFRYNFWFFQIKHKKLGCTFAEWWRGKPFKEGET